MKGILCSEGDVTQQLCFMLCLGSVPGTAKQKQQQKTNPGLGTWYTVFLQVINIMKTKKIRNTNSDWGLMKSSYEVDFWIWSLEWIPRKTTLEETVVNPQWSLGLRILWERYYHWVGKVVQVLTLALHVSDPGSIPCSYIVSITPPGLSPECCWVWPRIQKIKGTMN